jgi:hypothetical protein
MRTVNYSRAVQIFPRTYIALDHDLAYHSSLSEQLLRAFCFGKRKSPCDERLDLLLLKQFEQGD